MSRSPLESFLCSGDLAMLGQLNLFLRPSEALRLSMTGWRARLGAHPVYYQPEALRIEQRHLRWMTMCMIFGVPFDEASPEPCAPCGIQ